MIYSPRPGTEDDTDEALLMVYDAWNRLTKVYKDDGGQTGEWDGTDTLVVTYEYDGGWRGLRPWPQPR